MKFTDIQIHTTNSLALHTFYGHLLGLPAYIEEGKLTVQMGHTRMQFLQGKAVPPYHFAINIPANKGPEALRWLKERVEVLPFLGDELVPFDFWNAEAIYFLDPDDNIVELIARKNLPNEQTEPFSSNQWLGVSEMGTPTEDIQALYHWIHREAGMVIFSGNFDRFCAIGGEEALFIAVDRYKKKWIPVDFEAIPSPFLVTLEDSSNSYQFQFADGHFTHP